MASKLKYAVFGNGSWATAIVKMLCEKTDSVGWYVRKSQTIDYIKKEQHNPSYLTSIEFDVNRLILSDDINKVARSADVLVFAIPSAFIYEQLKLLNVNISEKIIR